MLTEHGADEIAIRNVNREPVALTFVLTVQGVVQSYHLAPRIDKIVQLLADIPRAKKTRQQAVMVAWRCIKDWVEAQLALIDAGQVTMPQAMFAWLETSPGGPLLYEAYVEHRLQLPPASMRD